MKEKCIICESGHSTWVDEQHDAGLSTRQIAAELKEKFGLSVSHVSVASHLNHGDKSDRMGVLEARIRNLEMWVLKCIPATTALNWFENDAGGFREYSIGIDELYLSSIPQPDGLTAVENALKTNLKTKIETESAAQKEAQRLDIEKRNEILAKEQHEREEMQRQAKELEEKESVEKMRKSVNEYDSRPKTI